MALPDQPTKVTTTQVARGFITKNKSRDSARRKLSKYFNNSVEFLASTINDPQEATSMKVTAAKILVTKYLDVLKEENMDKIYRLEKQLQYFKDSVPDGEFETEEDEDNTPLIDFDNIVDVE